MRICSVLAPTISSLILSRRGVALLFAVAVAGCAAVDEDPEEKRRAFDYRFVDADGIPVGGDTFTFAATPLGERATISLTLENTGQETFTLGGSTPFRLEGDASSFAIGPLSSVTVPPERPLDLVVTFQPDRLGTHNTALTFSTGIGASGPLLLSGDGLEGDVELGVRTRFYEGEFEVLPDFDDLDADVDTIQRTINIDARNDTDAFAARFNAFLDIPADGTWRFFTTADDGVRLLIDGATVVDDDGLHGARERNGEVTLTSGLHTIEVLYFEGSGGETLEVRWAGPGVEKALIPGIALRVNG